jgi:C-terminal processing protease CtpA/Prc
MKLRRAAVFAIILLLWGISLHVMAEAPGTLNEVQVRRLADVGRLWGAVRFFHPWLAEGKIDWDQALIQAIPRVKAASTSEEFRAAVDFLLSFLNDPASRTSILEEEPGSPEPTAGSPAATVEPPTLKWIKDDIALISVPDPRPHPSPDESSPFAAIAKEAAKAEAVIFDLRVSDRSGFDPNDPYVWNDDLQSCLLSFVQGEVALSSQRYRMYVQHPGNSPGFNTFVNKLGKPYQGQASRPYRLVLIFDDQIPYYAWGLFPGLQSRRLGYTIFEGEKGPWEASATHRMTLSDKVEVEFRIADWVHPDGSSDFIADKAIAPSRGTAQKTDQALAWAVQAAEGKIRPAAREKVAWVPPQILMDKSYAAPEYPSEELRLLGLFRFWTDIQFFSPYRDLMDHPWEDALMEFVPKIAAAGDALEYHLRVAELTIRIQDSHTVALSQVLRQHFGTHHPPLEVKGVEEQTVVTHVFSQEGVEPPKIFPGDVILSVDGEDVAARSDRISRSFGASTPQSLRYKVHQRMLAGPQGSEARIEVRHADGTVAEHALKRTMTFPRAQRETPVFGVLPEGLGYMDLERLRASDVDKAFEAIRDTPGLILDIRGYPQGTGFLIARRLASEKVTTSIFEEPEVHGMRMNWAVKRILEQTIEPSGPWRYEGKVVVLINEEAISQAEHACLYLEAAASPVFIGSPTTGANGMVHFLPFPGGIRISYTAYGVRHGDGRQLQRVGIQPHITVRPTIQGIRDGRDEVLETAISYLKGAK